MRVILFSCKVTPLIKIQKF